MLHYSGSGKLNFSPSITSASSASSFGSLLSRMTKVGTTLWWTCSTGLPIQWSNSRLSIRGLVSAFFLIFVLNFNKVKKDFRKYFYVVSYVFAYFISYMLLYGWYAPVSRANWPLIYGDRLILSGFIPFLFVVSIFIIRYSKVIFLSYGEDKKVSFITIFNVLILYLIVPDSLLLIKKSITMFAGK